MNSPNVPNFSNLVGETVAGGLDLVERFLPPSLMSHDSFGHTRSVARLFPSDAVDFFGFETRLAPGAPDTTDCALNLTPKGAALIAQGQLAGESPLWDRVARFHQIWAKTHTEAHADAPATWLEFDAAAKVPSPNLLFGYWPDDVKSNRPWSYLQAELFPMLLDGTYSDALRNQVQRCFEARPAQTVDFQFGFMLSRPIQAVRICVFDIPLDRVPAYLDAIGWEGDRPGLEQYISAFKPFCDFVGLHFDVGAQVFPHIGIEPNFRSGSWSRQPHREPRWQGLFDVLADFNLLDPEKRTALMEWVGHEKVLSGDKVALMLRGLSHIKVVHFAPGQSQAKAYFGIAKRPLTSEALP